MAGHVLDLDGLAGERAGHIDRPAVRRGDAVAAMADMVDDELFSQSGLR